VQTLHAYQVYLANQLLESKLKVWLENKHRSRDLLNWREWRFIERYKSEFNWEIDIDLEIDKESFLKKSKQYFYLHLGGITLLTSVVSYLIIAFVWNSVPFFYLLEVLNAPWAQIERIRWELTQSSERVNNDDSEALAAIAFAKDSNVEQALKVLDNIEDSYAKARSLSAIAEVYGKLEQLPEANKLLQQALDVEGLKLMPLSAIAEAQANLKNWGQALKVAQQCPSKDCEVELLAKILTVYAEQQHPELKEEEDN
jgi:tetratricopeptide (TPR) repeat protein